MRVCVVGAGLAGLAAGDALRDAGAEVVIREARDRVGGRVWTSAVGDGMRVEMGAEFVTEGYEVLPRLAARLGLTLAPMGMSFGDREPRGGIGVSRGALEEACALTADAVARGEGDGLSFAELLESLPIEPGARELIACRVAVSYAHPAERIAASAVRDVAHLFSAVEARRIGEGNQSIAVRLAEGLDVRPGSPVRRIVHHDAGIEVDGERYDGCVVAVPGNAIAEMAFEPALPAWKAESLGRVVYGAAAKLFVPIRGGRPTPSSVLSVPGRFWTWTAREADGEVAPVVSSFAGSAPAVEPLLHGTSYLEGVAGLRPDLDLEPGQALLSTWEGGAYSTREPGRPEADDAALVRPVGRIAFAGEHTERDWFATMEGALRSGHRAAADVRIAVNRR